MIKNKTALVLLPLFWPQLPPLGLASLKGYLTAQGIKCDVIDLNNHFYRKADGAAKIQWKISGNTALENTIVAVFQSETAAILKRYQTIGFSCYKSNIKMTVAAAKMLKKENPKIKIIFGGPEIAGQYFLYGAYLPLKYNGISDYLVVGEGELPLKNYLANFAGGKKIAVFEELETLRDYPSPDYVDLCPDNYPKEKSISMMFTRGCQRKCRFCSEKYLHKKCRNHSADSIIDQIRKHTENGIGHFIFHDSMVNSKTAALAELCAKIIKYFGDTIKWEAQMAIKRDTSLKLLRDMKKSGCCHLFIGLESGSEKILRRMNKGYRQADAAAMFKKLNQAGLSFGISLIAGYPGETWKEMEESLNFIIGHKHLIPKIEQINPFIYYSGTEAEPGEDYRLTPGAVARAHYMLGKIKKAGIRHTDAFAFNLIEK